MACLRPERGGVFRWCVTESVIESCQPAPGRLAKERTLVCPSLNFRAVPGPGRSRHEPLNDRREDPDQRG